jgi:hypothetical protein
MKSKDVFGIAVRVIGLLFLYQALTQAPSAIAGIWVPHFYFRNLLSPLFLVGWPLLIAFWLVRGAPWLMRLAYRNEAKENPANPAAPTVAGQ